MDETYIKMQQGLPDKPIPYTAVAYLAGLIDGEGTVSLRRKIGNHFNIEVYITSSNKPMLEWVQRVFGGKIYTYNRKGDTTRLPQHKWHIHSKGAEALLRMVLPYLIIKGEHARLAVEFRGLMDRDTSWHREFANKIKDIQKTVTYKEPSHPISQDQLQEMIHNPSDSRYLAWTFGQTVWAEIVYTAGISEVYAKGTKEYEAQRKELEDRHLKAWKVQEYWKSFTSMEQLQLAYVMKEKYNKTWNGEKWILSEISG